MDTFGIFPSVPLIEVVKIAQCLLTINIELLLCTVIKLHVVKEAIQRSSIQGRNLILLLSIHSGVRLIDVSF